MSISASHFKGDIRKYVRQRFRITPARYMLIVNDRPWLASYRSPDFLNRPLKVNPLKLLESVFFFYIQDSLSSSLEDRSRFSRRRTCCPSLDFAFWSEGHSTKEGKKRLKKRQRQKKRSLSNALHRTMNFPHHSNVSAECLSDSLQQILKCDNGHQKWVMVSFCWFHFPDPPYPPGLCTSIN